MNRFIDKKYVSLKAYIPGEQPRDKKYIKLNTNESPYPPSPAVLEAVNSNEAAELRLYSDPTSKRLKTAIAEYLGVGEDMVFVSNGSDESLNFLFMAFCEKGAAFADITYGFYKVFAELYGKKMNIIPLKGDFTIDTDKFAESRETLFIANPNAPTGIFLPLAEIEKLLLSNRDRLVVVDEAYIDFGGESAVSLLGKYDNLAVVQTFSKSRQLAGARIGFTVASPEITAGLEKIKYSTNPYNVNRLSELCGTLAMKDRAYFDKTRNMIIKTREKTKKELAARGFEVTQSDANFLFVKCPYCSGRDFYEKLKERGILVRYLGGERAEDYVRVTVGSDGEMDSFIKAADCIKKETQKI